MWLSGSRVTVGCVGGCVRVRAADQPAWGWGSSSPGRACGGEWELSSPPQHHLRDGSGPPSPGSTWSLEHIQQEAVTYSTTLQHNPTAKPYGTTLRHPPTAQPCGTTLQHNPVAPPYGTTIRHNPRAQLYSTTCGTILPPTGNIINKTLLIQKEMLVPEVE